MQYIFYSYGVYMNTDISKVFIIIFALFACGLTPQNIELKIFYKDFQAHIKKMEIF